MHFIRRTVLGAIAIIAMVFSLFSIPISASATSDYDDFITVTPTVSVYTDGDTKSQTMNLTDIWWEEIKQSYERGLALNSGAPANFVPKFEEIVANGGSSGIVVENTYAGKLLHVFASNDPNIECEFTGSSTILDVFWCVNGVGYDYVSANYITHGSYGGGWCNSACSDNGINVFSSPQVVENALYENYVFAAHLGNIHNFEFHYLDFDIEYPPGYEGEIIPTQPPLLEYVAMGDSFSSGEGVETFLAGTANDGTNECHRSNNAYPKLLQRDTDFNYHLKFVACSGATTSNVMTSGQWGEQAQIDALSETTDVVTLTIGGNDVDFSEFAKKCLSPLNTFALDEVCDEYTDIYDETMNKIINDLPDSLEDTYEAILTEAPNAEVYIGGYPIIAPYKSITDPFDNNCGGLYDEIPNNWGDARAAYEVVTSLNEVIEDAVSAVNLAESSTRLHFVDVSAGAFLGHDVCSNDSYFNGIDIFNQEYSVHPNTNGQQAYKEDFVEELN